MCFKYVCVIPINGLRAKAHVLTCVEDSGSRNEISGDDRLHRIQISYRACSNPSSKPQTMRKTTL